MNDGRLRLFDAKFDKVKIVEADGERTYGSLVPMNRYRRTVAMVKISDSDIYVVDIFRVGSCRSTMRAPTGGICASGTTKVSP